MLLHIAPAPLHSLVGARPEHAREAHEPLAQHWHEFITLSLKHLFAWGFTAAVSECDQQLDDQDRAREYGSGVDRDLETVSDVHRGALRTGHQGQRDTCTLP